VVPDAGKLAELNGKILS